MNFLYGMAAYAIGVVLGLLAYRLFNNLVSGRTQ